MLRRAASLQPLFDQVREDAGSPEYVQLAEALYREGQLTDAFEVITKGTRRNPHLPDGWLMRAIISMELEDEHTSYLARLKLHRMGAMDRFKALEGHIKAPMSMRSQSPKQPDPGADPIEPRFLRLLPSERFAKMTPSLREQRERLTKQLSEVLIHLGGRPDHGTYTDASQKPAAWLLRATRTLDLRSVIERSAGATYLECEQTPSAPPAERLGQAPPIWRTIGEIENSGPDRCYVAHEHTLMGLSPIFVRELSVDAISPKTAAILNYWMLVRGPGLANPMRIEREDDRLRVGFSYVPGIDIRQLGPISFPLALALLREARRGLQALHAWGMTHGCLRASRVRVGLSGRPFLCFGLDPQPITAAAEHARLAAIILRQAVDDMPLFKVLRAEDQDTLTVAHDRIVEIDPTLAPLAHEALGPVTAELAKESPDISSVEALSFLQRVCAAVLQNSPPLDPVQAPS